MIYNLQVLRALAAFAVLFVHMDLFAEPLGLEKGWLEFGNAGVDIFFVLSGFLMVHTSFARPPGAVAFMKNRLLRIVPLYWSITLAVFAIAFFMPALVGATRANFDELLKSLLFIPFVKSNGLVMPVLFVGWTINYEIFFYLTFSLFLKIARSRVKFTALLTSALIILIVLSGLWLEPTSVELRFFSKSIILEFAIGMVLALALGSTNAVGRTPALWLFFLAFIFLLGGATWLSGWPRWMASGIPAGVLLTCAVSLERHGLCVKQPWILLLGDSSYALYLTHPFTLQGLGKLLPLNASVLLVLAMLLLAIALALIVAFAMHKWFEVPVTLWLRQKVNSTIKRPAAQP